MADRKQVRFRDLNQEDQERKVTGVGKVLGTGVRVIKDLIGQIRRNPSVRAWAQSKREEKGRLRRTGLSGSDLRQALRQWVSNNPKPQGSDSTNAVDLGRSNQSNGNANSNIGTFVGVPNIPQTQKASINPLIVYAVLGYVVYLGLKQFKIIK